jgi:hypothetical protein
MNVHLYAVGEVVRLRRANGDRGQAGPYRIVDRLPLSDGEPSYRVESDLERTPRVVLESELRELR